MLLNSKTGHFVIKKYRMFNKIPANLKLLDIIEFKTTQRNKNFYSIKALLH